MRSLLWLVPLFPLAGFLVNGLLYIVSHRTKGEPVHGPAGHPSPPGETPPSAHGENPAHTHAKSAAHDPEGHSPIPFKSLHSAVGTASVGLACLFAFLAIFDVGIGRLAEGAVHVVTLYRWIPLGVNQAVGQIHGPVGEWFVDAAFRLDSLSALMIAFVTFVGFLIHVYSVGYMGHEEGYGRYFAYLNLFMFSMLVLVLGNNFLMLFVGWEGVGLCSYLLIGYFYDLKAAADAGKKAFVVNRIGDFGFILGIFGIFSLFGSVDFGKVFPAAAANPGGYAPFLTVVCLCLFVGACGKSAQFPLYVWLPDAMAGPTPGLRAHPRRDDGDGGRLHGRAVQRALPARARRPSRGRRDRRIHGALRGDDRRWLRTTSRRCSPTRRSPSSATCSSRAASGRSSPGCSTS